MSQDMDRLAKEYFYMNPEMIRFLLIENLTLKLTLNRQGILKSEDFAECKKEATQILDQQAEQRIEEWKKANPQVIDLFNKTIQKATEMSENRPLTEDGVAVVSVSS